jgi:chondroitin 4-sulfotransferase 11
MRCEPAVYFDSRAAQLTFIRVMPEQRSAVLLDRYHAVYIEVPKVACSSIKIALAGLLGVDLAAFGGDPHQAPLPAPPSESDGPVLYPDLFSFAFVRNPWDRLVSCYRDKILGEVPDFTAFHPTRGVAYCLARFDAFRAGMTFDEFVDAVADIPDEDADDHFRSQHTFVTTRSGDIGVDFVGRFETLTDDFRRVGARLGFPALTLPYAQAARTPAKYVEYHSARTRHVVASRFARDLSVFGYEFGGKT